MLILTIRKLSKIIRIRVTNNIIKLSCNCFIRRNKVSSIFVVQLSELLTYMLVVSSGLSSTFKGFWEELCNQFLYTVSEHHLCEALLLNEKICHCILTSSHFSSHCYLFHNVFLHFVSYFTYIMSKTIWLCDILTI